MKDLQAEIYKMKASQLERLLSFGVISFSDAYFAIYSDYPTYESLVLIARDGIKNDYFSKELLDKIFAELLILKQA